MGRTLENTKAFISPRPLRVAFLVDESEHWSVILSAIFAECYGRWGGRFNLIVPCDDNNVRQSYMPWLKAYDADIVYSYVELTNHSIENLHEVLNPSYLVKHRLPDKKHDFWSYRPQLPMPGLTSLSVAPIASRTSVFAPQEATVLLDKHPQMQPSLFLQHSFGFYETSRTGNWPIARDTEAYMASLTIVAKETLDNPSIRPHVRGESVTDEAALLKRIGGQRNIMGVAQLSAAICPRFEFADNRWCNGATIIVGDSFANRLLFWNARSHLPAWMDDKVVTLQVAKEDIEDPIRLASIIDIIRNRIHASEGGGGQLRLTLRSAAHSQPELDAFTAIFRAADTWNAYRGEALTSEDDCIPDHGAVQHGRFQLMGPSFPSPADLHEVIAGSAFRPPNLQPRHLREISPLPLSLKNGVWCLDVDLERSVNHSRFDNVTHRWRLPRRLRMTSAFIEPYQIGPNGPLGYPRVNAAGILSIFASDGAIIPEVSTPTDEAAFRSALTRINPPPSFDQSIHLKLEAPVRDIGPSDKGKYLTALLTLGQSVNGAAEIFLNEFWRAQFEEIGATPSANDVRLTDVRHTVEKRFKGAAITTEDDIDRLARLILKEAREVRNGSRYLHFDRVAERFENFRNTFWTKNEPMAPREEWDIWEQNSLPKSMQYLCERKILHQGFEWRCPQCRNRNWISIIDLSTKMICNICEAERPAPVNEPWHFRLNGFVLEGLREHGMLAYIWCLHRVLKRSKSSFFFLEPQELFYDIAPKRRQPSAEVDLLIVADGVVHLCEAKTSDRKIDLQKLSAVARRLRPDFVTLAVMEEWTTTLEKKANQLRELLSGTDIQVELMTLLPADVESAPNLPH